MDSTGTVPAPVSPLARLLGEADSSSMPDLATQDSSTEDLWSAALLHPDEDPTATFSEPQHRWAWHAAGFGPDEAREWAAVGYTSLEARTAGEDRTAVQCDAAWQSAGFSIYERRPWLAVGFVPERAALWRRVQETLLADGTDRDAWIAAAARYQHDDPSPATMVAIGMALD